MLEDPGLAVDVGDRRSARGGVRERRVVGHQAEVVLGDLDLAQVHRADRPVGDLELVGLAGPVVGDRERVLRSAVATRRRPAARVCSSVAIASPLRAVRRRLAFSHRGPAGGAFLGRLRAPMATRAGCRLGAKARRADAVRRASRAATTCSRRALSFGQDPRWRRAMVAAVRRRARRPGPRRRHRHRARRARAGRAATAARSSGSTRAPTCSPARGDASPAGPSWRGADRARRGRGRAAAVRATREFDHLTFTYLLRYVDDPAATLARARPGGEARRADRRRSSSACPTRRSGGRCGGSTRALGLPALGRRVRRATGTRSAASSGRASRSSTQRWPLERQLELWRAAGDLATSALAG